MTEDEYDNGRSDNPLEGDCSRSLYDKPELIYKDTSPMELLIKNYRNMFKKVK